MEGSMAEHEKECPEPDDKLVEKIAEMVKKWDNDPLVMSRYEEATTELAAHIIQAILSDPSITYTPPIGNPKKE